MFLNMRIFRLFESSYTISIYPNLISFNFDKCFIDTISSMERESATYRGITIAQEMDVVYVFHKGILHRGIFPSEQIPGEIISLNAKNSRATVDINHFMWKGFIEDSFHPQQLRTTTVSLSVLKRLYEATIAPIEDLPLFIDEEDHIIKNYIKERLEKC